MTFPIKTDKKGSISTMIGPHFHNPTLVRLTTMTYNTLSTYVRTLRTYVCKSLIDNYKLLLLFYFIPFIVFTSLLFFLFFFIPETSFVTFTFALHMTARGLLNKKDAPCMAAPGTRKHLHRDYHIWRVIV